MDCNLSNICGGCSLRHLSPSDYKQYKINLVQNALQSITRQEFSFAEPIFIDDGGRRRASLAFRRKKSEILLGFNTFHSDEIVNVPLCAQLTTPINRNLEFFRKLLAEICRVPVTVKNGRKKKQQIVHVESGDLWITEADNGLDVVLEFNSELNLDLRQLIFEQVITNDEVIRVSHRKDINCRAETILEKAKPLIKAGCRDVYIPAGTFLQPSKEGQNALTSKVLKYIGETSGKIADLFCGVGTFSYPLAQNLNNKITAVDSSAELLSGFKDSINRQMIPNIEIVNRNLFKDPLAEKELHNFAAVVFDPPRAGAREQVRALAALETSQKPQKLVAISCDLQSFIRDAEILQSGGYRLSEVTMIDQFVFTAHTELVALFLKD